MLTPTSLRAFLLSLLLPLFGRRPRRVYVGGGGRRGGRRSGGRLGQERERVVEEGALLVENEGVGERAAPGDDGVGRGDEHSACGRELAREGANRHVRPYRTRAAPLCRRGWRTSRRSVPGQPPRGTWPLRSGRRRACAGRTSFRPTPASRVRLDRSGRRARPSRPPARRPPHPPCHPTTARRLGGALERHRSTPQRAGTRQRRSWRPCMRGALLARSPRARRPPASRSHRSTRRRPTGPSHTARQTAASRGAGRRGRGRRSEAPRRRVDLHGRQSPARACRSDIVPADPRRN